MAVHAPARASSPHEQDADWHPESFSMHSSPPRITPFHLISHPASTSDAPLPPHLARLAAGGADLPGDLPQLSVSRGTSPTRPPPNDPHRPPNPPFLGIHSPRRVSSGSTSSRAGSLSIVRSGRLAPQRDAAPVAVTPASSSPDRSTASPLPEPAAASSKDTGSKETLAKDLPALPDDHAPTVPPPPSSSYTFASASAPAPAPAPKHPGAPSRRTSLAPPQPPALDMSFHPSHPSSVLTASPTTLSPAAPRISRRSTNPTLPSPLVAQRSPLTKTLSTHSIVSPRMPSSSSHAQSLDGFDIDLAPDILAQAEILRRERLERRQKMSQSSNASPAGPDGEAKYDSATPRRKETAGNDEDRKVLVGNLIGEDHVNYVLMYNMLTGIRIGVSRCQAKIKRPLTEDDYLARHKFSFDIIGNELTPSARYDFKFKDYAPWVFRELRDDYFHLDPADYLLSLTAKYILSELGSPGKSGSFFYFSRDYRFIIKTISHSEHKFLRSILKDYHEHVRANPHTLLSRFYGLHRVKLPRGRKIHFVIMNNLFPPHRDIHETYDLKGSAWGREYPEEKAKINPRAVLKDKNWVNRRRKLELGPEKRALLTEQLRRDMEFLKKIRVMDYSLLVGIHNMERGNRDNLREKRLAMFHPDMPVRRKPSSVKQAAEASSMRRAFARSDPKMLDVASHLPLADSADRRHFLFYQDEGGLRATDELNASLDTIYYLGVIDICTPYNTFKRIEHFWKSMTESPTTISCVEPVAYGQRFLNFLMSVMRGGDPALRPQGLEPPEIVAQDHPVGGDHGPATAENEKESSQPNPNPNPNLMLQVPAVDTNAQHDATAWASASASAAEAEPTTEHAMVGHLKAE